VIAAQAGLADGEGDPEGGGAALLRLLEAVAGPIASNASILDLGCGIGNCVRVLLDHGYDAYGVDIYEYWGKDRDLYWEGAGTPIPEAERTRLSLASLVPYKLPFSDASFDFIVSGQVLEHVDDLEAVFREIARTLKLGGTSIHVFPGRWAPPIEGHIGVPLPVLCQSDAYLKAMAILGLRSSRQRGLSWTDAYRANREQMKISHYPRRREVLKKARRAGLEASFIHDLPNARPWVARLYDKLASMGLPGAATTLVKALQQPRLLLRHPANKRAADGLCS
jgi:SAM-dependent methyltransferase